MKISTSTKVKIIIEDEKDLAVWQSLFEKLSNYLDPVKQDMYKTTAVGFLPKIEISKDEQDLIGFINKQLNVQG